MNNKLIKNAFLCNIIFIILTATLFHFLFDIFNKPIFLAAFLPVNESIFEHTKLLFTPTIITFIIFYFFICKRKINKEKALSSLIISISFSIITMLSLYYLTQLFFTKEMMIVNILILFIGTVAGQILALLTYKKDIKWSKEISIYSLITMTVIFLIFTLNPPYLDFFYDTQNMSYGIR